MAKRVGIATTSIYLHFADVEQLVAAVTDRRFAEMLAAQNAAEERSGGDPAQALLARCHAYAHFALDHPAYYRVLFQVDLARVPVDNYQHLPGHTAFEHLVRAVKRCLDAGVARPHADPFRLAILVWATEHGLVSLRLDRPRFPWPPLDDLLDEGVSRIAGLAPAPG